MAVSNNKDRIVDAALELFNEHGVRAITTNHIAEHLGISPGNLYYHFRNKEEIVRAIFPQIEATAHASIVLPDQRELTAGELAGYYLAGLESLWRYRFFYADVDDLVQRDEVLGDWYRRLHRWLVATFVDLFELLARQGHLDLALSRRELERIAVNAFIIWLSWVGYVRTTRPEREIDRAEMAEGALQSFSVLAPYLEESFRKEAGALIESASNEAGATAAG